MYENRITKGKLATWLAIDKGILPTWIASKNYCKRENRNATRTTKISPWKWTNLQKMDVCLILNWKINSKKIWRNYSLQKYEKRIEKKKQQNGRDEERKPNYSFRRGKTNKLRERKPNGYQCLKGSSIYSGKPNQCGL